MNLLFLNRTFPVLSQTFVLDHIAYATNAGHKTAVAALKLSRGVEHPVIERLGLYDTMRYSRPIDARNVVRTAKAIATHLPRLGGAFRRSALGRPTLTETSIALQLEHEPDVIIANFGPTGFSAVRLKESFFPHAKVVVIFHGYDVSGYIRKRGWDNYQRMAKSVDMAVAVNAQWAELLRTNTAMAHVVVHHLGVDCAQIPQRLPHGENNREILFVGRMTEKKGFRHLIRAVSILAGKGLKLRVHAVGDGPLLEARRKQIRDLQLEELFVLHGAQPHGFILSKMQEADMLVAPSITASDGDQEGIPIVLMEAMASGMPVIATRHSGIPELVIDGKSGLLIEEKDDNALAAKMEALILNPDLGNSLGAAASARVREHFNAATQNTKLFALIEALAG